MLMLAGKCGTIEDGIILASEKLESGEGYTKFIDLIEMQGGDINLIKNIENYPKAKYEDKITASSDGYIEKLDALTFGTASVNLGCGRNTVGDKIDYSSAILLEKKIGHAVSKGDVICRILGESRHKIKTAKDALIKGITVSENRPKVESRIIEVIY
jgi:pyrimidine-nucleoside phosphorylase